MAMSSGLYDVPQTDLRSEAAMASLIERLRASVAKPETIPAGAGTDDAIALQLAAAVAEVSNALGDRATLPLLKWDAKLDSTARKIAYKEWLDTRGRQRDAGTPDIIDGAAQEAREYLACLASGNKRQSIVPRYVDSGANVPLDAPLVSSSGTADAWTCRVERGGAYG